MYTTAEERSVEDICFDRNHILDVTLEIEKQFPVYFDRFIKSVGGTAISDESFEKLIAAFGTNSVKRTKQSVEACSDNYTNIILKSIDSFESDQDDYQKLFDLEFLADLDEDASTFKSKYLRNECPIIRKTLNNTKAKELNKYRADFNTADSDYLLAVVTNLATFSVDYAEEYEDREYGPFYDYEDMGLDLLDTDDYTAYGVIGGGIKTHMLYKNYPSLFPNRSRNAIWALWYLTDKRTFECEYDSEFLMIDPKKVITQQNYFYPYRLFAFYAYQICEMLKKRAEEMNVNFNSAYRYVITDAFLDYVAGEHMSEIELFAKQIREGRSNEYA